MPTINTKQSNASQVGNKTQLAVLGLTALDKSRLAAGNKRLERQAIYNTQRWSKLRREVLMQHPLCEICGINLAEHVHHIISFMDYDYPMRLNIAFDSNNLQAVC
jgi:hypothetical protein